MNWPGPTFQEVRQRLSYHWKSDHGETFLYIFSVFVFLLDLAWGGISGFSIIAFLLIVAGIRSYFSRKLANIEKLLEDNREHVSVLTEGEAINLLLNRLSQATSVTNTNVNITHLAGKIDRDTNTHADIEALYQAFLANGKGGTWKDIIGVSEMYSERYPQVSAYGNAGKLLVQLLRHSAPIINFVVVEGDDFKEVYFGWVADDSKPGPVFYTQSRNLVALFERYDEVITERYSMFDNAHRRIAVKPEVSIAKSVMLVDRKGIWLTAEIVDSRIVSFGIIDISFDKGRTVISTRIYDSANTNPRTTEHEPKNVTTGRDKIFFTYWREDGRDSTKSQGLCFYKFELSQQKDSGERLTGYVADFRTQSLSRLVGVKIRDGISDIKEVSAEEFASLGLGSEVSIGKLVSS